MSVYLSAAQTSVIQQTKTDVEPIAQSFIIDTPGGAFVTSLDLYFSAKDANLPVTVDIRAMENGIPTGVIVPYSTVSVESASVMVSNNGTVATKFTFPSPVFLLDTAEYCFVVTSNSNAYKLWIAEIGKFDAANPEYTITKQPYSGVMFKSQNASTWLPQLDKDVKFLMRRAEFVSSGDLILNEAPIPTVTLGENPLLTTIGQRKIRIYHRNHGHIANTSQVIISGLASGGDYNGIAGSAINGTKTVVDAEQDSYTIEVSPTASIANSTGRTGGSSVTVTENRVYDIFYPNVQLLTFNNTLANWYIRTTSGKSLAGSESPHSLSEYSQIPVNQNVKMTNPKVIRGVNTDAAPNNKSLYLKGSFSTTNPALSPVLDLNRTSAVAINYRLDRPAASLANGYNVVSPYIPDTAANGTSTLSKYITRRVDLTTAASAARIYLSTNRPTGSYIDVYYKVTDNLDVNFDSLGWSLVTSTGGVPINDNPSSYDDVEYDITEQMLGYVPAAGGNPAIPGKKFVAFAVKIVFSSTNSSAAPSCSDLRVIAVT